MIKIILFTPQWIRVALTLLYIGVLVVLSLMPAKDVPDINLFAGFDKVVHGGMYFGLTILVCWTMHTERRRSLLFAILLFSISLGLLMEFFQFKMMMGRAFEWRDEISNGIGTLIAAVLYQTLIEKHLKKMERTLNVH